MRLTFKIEDTAGKGTVWVLCDGVPTYRFDFDPRTRADVDALLAEAGRLALNRVIGTFLLKPRLLTQRLLG